MRKILLLSPFCAGEELICSLLCRLTDLAPYHSEHNQLDVDLSDNDWFAKGRFIMGHFNLTEVLAKQLVEKRALPIFLVRNIYDLLIDQYRYYQEKTGNFKDHIFSDLPQKTRIELLIKDETNKYLPSAGINIWALQMQEIFNFSNLHNCCVLSYEKLLHNPAEQIQRIINFLSIDLTSEQFDTLLNGISREIEEKTGANIELNEQYRYSLSCESISMLTGYHSAMIKNILHNQAPKLGWLSTSQGFPEVTSESPELLKHRLKHTFVSTVFKSGTKLLEHIIAKLTGLSVNTPGMRANSDYECTDPIIFETGKFFIWHNLPSSALKTHLSKEYANPVFLIRNIYDLVVSQYYHFAKDVDKEIGHSTGTVDYFAKIGRDEGISLLLCGATSTHFTWHGFGYYLRHIQEVLKYLKEYHCHVISYDRLVLDKRNEIERLARYLDIAINSEDVDKIIESSSLEAMRQARVASVGSGNHFRKGTPGDHINILKQHHYHIISHLILTYAPELVVLCEELGFEDIIAKKPAISEKSVITEE